MASKRAKLVAKALDAVTTVVSNLTRSERRWLLNQLDDFFCRYCGRDVGTWSTHECKNVKKYIPLEEVNDEEE